MERFLPRIWVFVMAFGLGTSISAIWRIYTLPVYSLPEPVIEPIDYSNRAVMEVPNGADASEGPRLVGETHSCGALAGPQVYNYTDGGRISVNCRRFKTNFAAAREYLNRLRSGTIDERAVVTDGNGSQIGEEFLMIAPQVVRVRLKGRVLCEIEASSLKHLSLFEKRP
jgi:hypothetical protein